MISQPASPACPPADLAALRPVAPVPGLRAFGLVVLSLMALGLAALAVLTFAPARDSLPRSAATFRPALAVMAPHWTQAEAPLMHRLDRDVTAVAAADIEMPVDPALSGQPAGAVPVPRVVAVPFPETTARLPAPAPLASPLRPPRAA